MRTTMLLMLSAIAVAIAVEPAPGRPKADGKGKGPHVVSLKVAIDTFAESVIKKTGGNAALKFRANQSGRQCKNSTKLSDDVLAALKAKGAKNIEAEDEHLPELGKDEEFAVEVVNGKDVHRFAMSVKLRRAPGDSDELLQVIACTSTTLDATYEVHDQQEVGKTINVNVLYNRPSNAVLIAVPPKDKDRFEEKDQIDVPGFGSIEIRKLVGGGDNRAVGNKKLKTKGVEVELGGGIKGWRYKCPELTAETEFVVVLKNNQPFAWGIDVMLDGRSSTEMAADAYKGARYILPPKEKDKEAEPCPIQGWLKGPKGAPGAGGVQTFEYTRFLVKNVASNDPILAGKVKDHASTIVVTWYGAWEEGTDRPRGLPNPQSDGPDVVGSGGVGTVDLKVVKYTMDKKPMGSVVIEFGGLAAKK